jgi:hypothetical protein
MENITTIPEQINYDYDSPYWALFGVQAPDAPMPEHPGFICAQGHPCDAGQQRQYNAYLAELQPWKDRNLAQYQQLNAKLQDYMQNGFNTTSEFYVQGYDIMGSHSVVTASKPGHISAGGNMLLDGNLVNDKSRIQAGSTIVTTGNVETIDAKSQDTTRHHGFSSYSYIRQSNGGDDERRWNHTPLDVTLPVTETTLVVATPQPNTTVQGSGTQIGNTPVVQLPNGDLIQAAQPNTRIPGNSLYQINPGNSKNYLIETDPRFASYGTWLTSDYMLAALGLDPAAMQKRLGDGFYEQQLIREQIGQLTGYRYLAGYLSDEAQYQALMNAGVEFAQTYNLTVGVALTAEQMAQLTGDIVWLVSAEVTLPDGTTETVLVPQLYTRASTAMITAGGSLISANNVYITGQDGNPVLLSNNATIAGREGLFVDVAYLQNKVGQLHGGDVVLRSATDIDNIGGTISGDNSITLDAARDINIVSTTADGKDAMGRVHGISNVASVYLSGREILTSDQPPEEQPASRSTSADTATSEQSSSNQGQILLSAGRDINLRAGYIGNDATVSATAEGETQTATGAASDISTGVATATTRGGVTTLVAGRNIDIGTVDMQGGMHENGTFNGTPSGNMMGYTSDSGSNSSITVAGISTGNITITNEDEQLRRTGQTVEEAIAAINDSVRTGQSVNGIEKNWDIGQLMGNMEAGGEITAAFGQQAAMGVANFATNQQKAIMAEMMLVQDKDSPEGQAKMAELQQELERWGEGGAYRVLAHTVVGGFTGDWSGAAGAGSSALMADQLNTITADLPPGVSEAVGAGLASGLGYLTGGDGGASTAFNQDTNNRQLHPEEWKVLDRYIAEGENRENVLAAACALVHCYEEFPAGSEIRTKLEAVAAWGNSAENEGLRNRLANETVQNYVWIDELGEEVPYDRTQLFQYSWKDSLIDETKRLNNTFLITDRGWGLVQAAGGVGTIVLGTAICGYSGGTACVAGAGVSTIGLDHALTGAHNTFFPDDPSKTFGARALESMGVPPQWSETVYALADVGGASYAANAIKIGQWLNSVKTNAALKGASASAQAEARLANNFYRDGAALDFPQQLQTSSGIVIRANPDKTTTVLGTYVDDTNSIINSQLSLPRSTVIDAPTQPGAFNLLNTPNSVYGKLGADNFWNDVNKPFIDAAIQRGDDIYLATDPNVWGALNRRLPDGSVVRTGFGREYDYLTSKGYIYDSSTGKMTRK